jgi:hypothetical protein
MALKRDKAFKFTIEKSDDITIKRCGGSYKTLHSEQDAYIN